MAMIDLIAAPVPLTDTFNRKITYLRVSVTDRCNLRCVYCMPEEGVEWLPKADILTYEEIASVVRASAAMGIGHFKLTGGEPTARRDLPVLAAMLRAIPGVQDLSLTTNGSVISAALVVAIIPISLLIAVFQERVVGGLTAGGVKG